MKKGQYATEYLIVFMISIMILLPVVFYLQSSFGEFNYALKTQFAHSASLKIRDRAEAMYHLGTGSSSSLRVYLPGVDEAYIKNNAIIFEVEGSDIYSISNYNVSGVLPNSSGRYDLLLEKKGDHISVGLK